MVEWILNLFSYALDTEEPLLIPGTTCIYTLYSLSYGVGILVFATSAAYDLIIFLMTALRCLRYFTNIPLLRSKVDSDRRPQLVTVVLRDCFFYFGILFTYVGLVLYMIYETDTGCLVPTSSALFYTLRSPMNIRLFVTCSSIQRVQYPSSASLDSSWIFAKALQLAISRPRHWTLLSPSCNGTRTQI